MRARGVAATVVLTLTLGLPYAGSALADPGDANDPGGTPVPTEQDVSAAESAVASQLDDVAAVRARLVVADQRLQAAQVAAAQAAEAFNGARWRADQARDEAAAARRGAAVAERDADWARATYTDSVVQSYEMAPDLTALAAVVRSDGISELLERSATMSTATSALDAAYDELDAASVLADVARDRAADAEAEAEAAEREARAARRTARAAADSAQAEADGVAAERDALVARLAELQHTSVALAARRQRGLEQRAAAAAARAAEQEAAAATESTPEPTPELTPTADPEPTEPQPTPDPTEPEPTETTAPSAPAAPRAGAAAAIAFARAQLGEPYRWAAAGPSAWDCSGLTMGAWAAGGVSLPHYSVAQYEQSTPITAGQLRPGDLVFWGSSGDPGSIYHVALYVGGGRIIHAPRTGRPVTEDSMYYWIAPTFFARP